MPIPCNDSECVQCYPERGYGQIEGELSSIETNFTLDYARRARPRFLIRNNAFRLENNVSNLRIYNVRQGFTIAWVELSMLDRIISDGAFNYGMDRFTSDGDYESLFTMFQTLQDAFDNPDEAICTRVIENPRNSADGIRVIAHRNEDEYYCEAVHSGNCDGRPEYIYLDINGTQEPMCEGALVVKFFPEQGDILNDLIFCEDHEWSEPMSDGSGCTGCAYCEWHDDYCGSSCSRLRIFAYNQNPPLQFLQNDPSTYPKLYLGFEFEVCWPYGFDPHRSQDIADWYERYETDSSHPSFFWIKRDGSLSNGLEFVTHPMTVEYGRNNYPFSAFQELIDGLDAYDTHEDAGTHIHLSKGAFSSSHLWKMVIFHLEMRDFVSIIAGRTDGEYTTLSPRSNDIQTIRKHLLSISKKVEFSHEQVQFATRYLGVNLLPRQTVELRYPRGGTNLTEILKNLEWVEAMFTYTRYVDVKDVAYGCLKEPGYILDWIMEGNYPNLQAWVQRHIPQRKKLRKDIS